MSFLHKVIAIKKKEIQMRKKYKSLQRIKKECVFYAGKQKTRSLKYALQQTSPPAIIAEIKLKSPSEGILTTMSCRDIAVLYAQSQADAISVLTDKVHFNGDIAYLKQVRKLVKQPIFRKDFIIDPYQIYETFLAGGDAFLLIVALLSKPQLREFIALGKAMGLESIVEVHNRQELRSALNANAEIIGINNRNLKTLKVDIRTTEKLIKYIPKEKIVISESGINTSEEVKELIASGVKGILVGTSIIKSKSPVAKIAEFKKSIN